MKNKTKYPWHRRPYKNKPRARQGYRSADPWTNEELNISINDSNSKLWKCVQNRNEDPEKCRILNPKSLGALGKIE